MCPTAATVTRVAALAAILECPGTARARSATAQTARPETVQDAANAIDQVTQNRATPTIAAQQTVPGGRIAATSGCRITTATRCVATTCYTAGRFATATRLSAA